MRGETGPILPERTHFDAHGMVFFGVIISLGEETRGDVRGPF